MAKAKAKAKATLAAILLYGSSSHAYYSLPQVRVEDELLPCVVAVELQW